MQAANASEQFNKSSINIQEIIADFDNIENYQDGLRNAKNQYNLKEKRINVGKDNKNDIISYLGEPSTTSTFDNDVWIYVERKITNSHFFGRRKLIINNILILEIDDKGLLAKKEFYNIDDMEEIKYDNSTTASLQKRDFIYNFLSSMRQRINDPLGVRKKKREQGTR